MTGDQWPTLRPMPKLARWAMIVVGAVLVAGSACATVIVFRSGEGDWLLKSLTLIASTAVGLAGAYLALYGARLTRRRDAQAEAHQAHQRLSADRSRADGRLDRAIDLICDADPERRRSGFAELDRLGKQHPELRQDIVDQVRTYLQRPFTMPKDCSTPAQRQLADRELEVRLRAQQVITDNLRDPALELGCDAHPDLPEGYERWDVVLDLRGTILINITFHACRLKLANFTSSEFRGTCGFDRSIFERRAIFAYAVFEDVGFPDVTFTDRVEFLETQFGFSWFGQVWCHGQTLFASCHFEDGTNLGNLSAVGQGSIRFSATVIGKPGINTWPPGWQETRTGDGPTTLTAVAQTKPPQVKETQS